MLHDDDVVGDLAHDGQVVGDEQVGQLQLGLQVGQQAQDLGLDQHVQGGDRLVEDDDLRLEGEGPGDGDALALTAGELVGVAAHDRARQGDHVEQLGDARLALLGGADPVDPQRFLDDAEDRVHRVQGAVGVLEDRLHDAPQGEELLGPQGGQVHPVVEHLAGGGVDEVQDDVGNRGLARAGLAHERRRRALADAEADVVDGGEGLVLALGAAHLEDLGEVLHAQDLLGGARSQAGAQELVVGDLDAAGVGGLDAPGGQGGGGLDQALGVGVAGVLEHLEAGAGLDDPAAVHDDDVLGPLSGQPQVVGDEEHRGAQLAHEGLEVVEDASLDGDVQGAGGLVGDEQVGAGRQADGDEGALAHAAGELVGVLLGPPGGLGQAGLLQQEGHLLVNIDAPAGRGGRLLGAIGVPSAPGMFGMFSHEVGEAVVGDAGQAVGPQRLLDLEADGPHRVEVGHGVLRHQADGGAAQGGEILGAQVGDVTALEADRAAGDSTGSGQQPDDGMGQGGLSRARLPHDGDRLAGVEGQVRLAHGRDEPGRGAEGDLQVADLQEGIALGLPGGRGGEGLVGGA